MKLRACFNSLSIKFIICLCIFIPSCGEIEIKERIIEDPYFGIDFRHASRVITTTHEHITSQTALEDYINRGIDVLCISNYSPSVPFIPISGFYREYIDWEIVRDDNGDILYETNSNGNTREIEVGGVMYKVPALKRVKKVISGGFSDFEKDDGSMTDFAHMPQLPNGEHSHYYWPEGFGLSSTKHINFIGSNWADVCNGNGEVEGIEKYNLENGYDLTSKGIRGIFPLWSITEMLDSVRNNLMFPGKVFGTINHPGHSGMSDRYIDAYMQNGGDIFKAMEIYNNSDTDDVKEDNVAIYDRTLLRGHKLWCVAVNDWGSFKPEQSDYPPNRGCIILYLNENYDRESPLRQAEMALDALISGQFSAAGYGQIYLVEVIITDESLSVTFNCDPDRTIIDIDGIRTSGGSNKTLSVDIKKVNYFVRFEAYIDDDFVFTNPFFFIVK